MQTYYLLFIVIFSFVLNPFMKKRAAISLNSEEFLIFNHVLVSCLLIFFTGYLLINKKIDLFFLKKLKRKELYWSFLASIVGIMGSIAFINLIKNEDITFIIPNIQPIVLILTGIFGALIFKENMSKYKILGILLIVFGSTIINVERIYIK